MSFRQHNHERQTQHKAFVLWREKVLADIELLQLPSTVFEMRDDWQYFVDKSVDSDSQYSRIPAAKLPSRAQTQHSARRRNRRLLHRCM